MATYFPLQQNLDPLGQALGQGLGQGINQWYMNRLLGQDISALQKMGQTQDIYNTMYGARGLQAPQPQFPQLSSPQGQQMGMQMLSPLVQEQIKYYQARTERAKRPQRTSGNTIDRLLRAAEISERQAKTAVSAGLSQKYREDARNFIKQAMDLMFPADTSETTEKQRKRAERIDQKIKKTEPPKTGVEPTAEDLGKYRRMGLEEYTSPSGKRYPLIKPGKPTPVKKKAITQTEANRLKTTFRKYHPSGRPTKKEFDTTLSHINSGIGKDIYFEMYWRPEFGR